MNIINKKIEKILLLSIVLMSSLFTFVNLSKEGLANTYYAATVKSMTLSLKNFFYAALDPAGFVTVDKPAFGFWIQAIFAKILGFSGWSTILPQAISAVLSVILIYIIVKKPFGSVAGLISALLLAITPIIIAAGRNNTIDNQVVLVVLLGVWSFTIAAREGKFKYLALCMIFIGIGFNIKMMQAYIAIPAIYMVYLFSTNISIKKRILHLSIASIILLMVSFSWALIVDSVPTDDRPAIGSSDDNTMMGLILGYNGFSRLNIFGTSSNSMGGMGGSGNNQMPGGMSQGDDQEMPQGDMQNDTQNGSQDNSQDDTQSNDQDMNQGNAPDDMQEVNFAGGPSGAQNGGTFPGRGAGGTQLSGAFGNQTPAGITRLFSKNMLSDQIVWFIILAVFSFIAVVIKEKIRFKLDTDKKQSIFFWMFWFLPGFIYFSYNTSLFHPHYMTMIAPPIAALAGIGIVYMWNMYKEEKGFKSWLLPISIGLNGAVHILMLSYFYSTSFVVKILTVVVIALCFTSVIALIVLKLLKNNNLKLKTAFLFCAVIGILIAPASGSAAAMFSTIDSTNPTAGLELLPTDNSESVDEDEFTMTMNANGQMGNPDDQTENSESESESNDDETDKSESTDEQVEDSDNQMGSPNNNKGNMMGGGSGGMNGQSENLDELVEFLNNNQVNGKNQIVVSSRGTAESLTLYYTDIYVGSLTGWGGNEKVMSIEKFKERIANGEIRYVLASESETGGRMGGRDSENEIMTWVEENGELISFTDSSSDSEENVTGQVYDLINSISN
jgi:4-amino-4-deoxy-L-arabinose transferase-like glycosyltransferase